MEKIKVPIEFTFEIKDENPCEHPTECDWVDDCCGLFCGVTCPFDNQKEITRSDFIEKYKQKEV